MLGCLTNLGCETFVFYPILLLLTKHYEQTHAYRSRCEHAKPDCSFQQLIPEMNKNHFHWKNWDAMNHWLWPSCLPYQSSGGHCLNHWKKSQVISQVLPFGVSCMMKTCWHSTPGFYITRYGLLQGSLMVIPLVVMGNPSEKYPERQCTTQAHNLHRYQLSLQIAVGILTMHSWTANAHKT